jgi:hypothetical protein
MLLLLLPAVMAAVDFTVEATTVVEEVVAVKAVQSQ